MENPEQPPIPPQFVALERRIQASFEEFKTKHNQIASGFEELEGKYEELIAEFKEIKEFLTFTSKPYRKFYHKRHLKSKFK